MMYAAVPIRTGGGQLLGVMRVALPMEDIETQFNYLREIVLLAGLAAALVAALLAALLAERIAQPVRQLTNMTERMAKGDLNTGIVRSTSDEVGQLNHAIAQMVEHFHGRLTNMAAALDQVSCGVLITEKNSHISLINAAAARMLGTAQERATGRPFAEVIRFQPLAQLLTACQDKGEGLVEIVEINPHRLVLQASVTPLPESEEEGCLVILQDLTRIRSLEMARRDLINNISQNLHPPLADLRVVVDTLLYEVADQPVIKDSLNRMDAEIDALTLMVDELLEMSRIESGQEQLVLASTSVAEVVIPPVDRLLPQAKLAGLELTVLIPPDIPQVLADIDRAQLTLSKLVHNAIEFTPPGGGIRVIVQPAGEEILFTVQDSGIGIPAEDLPRVFEWFYQVEGALSRDIAPRLAIAKQIVQGHGGRIWAESVEGQGSTFHFTLPLATNQPDEGQDPSTSWVPLSA
jgi:two-component system phosphate regulon sensor histidine kinase PhoR